MAEMSKMTTHNVFLNLLPFPGPQFVKSNQQLQLSRCHEIGSRKARSLVFLLKGLGQLPDDDLDRATSSDRESAELLVRELGGRPLALESAIQHMTGGRSKISAKEYLDLWKAHPRRLAGKRASNATNHLSEAATFDLLWESIQEESPQAADLIRLTAVLAHAPLTRIVLQEYVNEFLDANIHDLDWHETFDVALRMLRQPDEGTVTLHSLHRTLILDDLREEKYDWFDRAIWCLSCAFPDSADRSQWSRCDAIMPHVYWIIDQIERIEDVATTANLIGMGCVFHHRQALEFKNIESASANKAEKLYRRALEVDPNHPHILGNFALFLTDVRGQHDEAEQHYRRALEVDPNHANNLGNFIGFLVAQRRFDECRYWIDRFESSGLREISQVVAEVEMYKLILSRTANGDDTQNLIRLKQLLCHSYAHVPWSFERHLAVLRDFVRPDEMPLYDALAAAVLDESVVDRLNEFPRWRDLPE